MWRDEPESTGSATLAMAYLTLFQGTAASQVTYTEEGGALRDGTRYLMRVPSNWNGTLLRDLDYLTNVNNARYLDMLVRGLNAVSGTARHSRRWAGYYDPARKIAHLDTVLDLFVERFRKPDRIQRPIWFPSARWNIRRPSRAQSCGNVEAGEMSRGASELAPVMVLT